MFIFPKSATNPVPAKKNAEIFNNNDLPVYLDRWYIDDLKMADRLQKYSEIALKLRYFDLTSSIFNNDGDSNPLLIV
jgi:hypothetical protein